MRAPTGRDAVRILFVDDEPLILEGLVRTVGWQTQTDGWRIDAAASAEEAIDRMRVSTYDAVVTDLTMPGADGTALLEQVAVLAPCAARAVLSGRVEFDAGMRAFGVAHQVMTKPCPSVALVGWLRRVFAMRPGIDDRRVLDAVFAARKTMLAEGWSQARWREVLGGGGGTRICRDAGFALQVVRLANSSFMCGGLPSNEPEDALQRLGPRRVSAALDLTFDFAPAARFSAEQCHDRGRIAASLWPRDPACALAVGLFADAAILAGIDLDPDVCPAASALLLALWGLPPVIVDAVAELGIEPRLRSGLARAVACAAERLAA